MLLCLAALLSSRVPNTINLSINIFEETTKNNKNRQTFRIAGETELGPLQEKRATLDATGRPTRVLEVLSFAKGTLQNQNTLCHKQKSDDDIKRW